MIIYLGMPKCASTWLFECIHRQLGYNGIKEPHSLYEQGVINNNILDFSTNNWSMDSDMANAINAFVTHYILIVRNPMDLASSYYYQNNITEPFEEFCDGLHKQKLLCFGDILERWMNLVDNRKLLVYNYDNDILNKQDEFISDICGHLSIQPKKSKPRNVSNKPKLNCSVELRQKLNYQLEKFETLRKAI